LLRWERCFDESLCNPIFAFFFPYFPHLTPQPVTLNPQSAKLSSLRICCTAYAGSLAAGFRQLKAHTTGRIRGVKCFVQNCQLNEIPPCAHYSPEENPLMYQGRRGVLHLSNQPYRGYVDNTDKTILLDKSLTPHGVGLWCFRGLPSMAVSFICQILYGEYTTSSYQKPGHSPCTIRIMSMRITERKSLINRHGNENIICAALLHRFRLNGFSRFMGSRKICFVSAANCSRRSTIGFCAPRPFRFGRKRSVHKGLCEAVSLRPSAVKLTIP